MVRPRISETAHGIIGEFNTQAYDLMMRTMRDRGWIETNLIIKEGISSGLALEVGPGSGYLGLEWLKNTKETALNGLDISDDMIAIARKHALEYKLMERILPDIAEVLDAGDDVGESPEEFEGRIVTLDVGAEDWSVPWESERAGSR